MKPANLSLLVHLGMGLMLCKPAWFDIFRLFSFYSTEISVRNSMRVDVLALPELEKFIAAQEQPLQVLPALVSESKKRRDKKNKKFLESQPKMTRKEIVHKLRQRAGNVLQKGVDVLAPSVSVQGAVYEGDPFWLELQSQIKQHWNVPPHLKKEDLLVVCNVKLLPSGHVLEASVVKPSMDSTYDVFVKEFVEHRLVLNIAIPMRLHSELRDQGVNINFSP